VGNFYPLTNWQDHRLLRWLRGHWWTIAILAVAALEARIYFPLQPTRRMFIDTPVFLLGGDLLAAGYAPYLRLWDVKPPLIYDTTALLALVAPGNPWVQFYLGSALTAILAVVIVALAGQITHQVTGRPFAAFVTAATVTGFHTFVLLPGLGIFPKYFTLAFGLAALWASLDDRHVLASALATAAAGYWQWGLIFILLVYGRAWRQDRLARWRPMVLATVGVTIVAVAPTVAAGGGVAMVMQVVDVFRLGDRGQPLTIRIQRLIAITGFLWPVLVAGVVGTVEVAYRERAHYWLAAGAAWPLLQIGFVDFDTAPDLLLLVVFAALGAGVVVGTLRLQRHQRILVVCLVLALAGGQLYDHREALDTPAASDVDPDAYGIRSAFIDQRIPPPSCAISMSKRIERLYADRSDPRYCRAQFLPG
jgi:hypothetical protein